MRRKGVTLQYTCIERAMYWFKHYQNNSVQRAGEKAQFSLFYTLTLLRIYCGTVNDYRPLSSLLKVFIPFTGRHKSPNSRRIVLLSIRKSNGLKLPTDLRALVPWVKSHVPIMPSPPVSELEV
jgi:hypothetical protein